MNELPASPGVYKIVCSNGQAYVGQSTDLRRRAQSHMIDAEKGEHHNPELARSLQDGGARIKVLETIEGDHLPPELVRELLLRREAYWMLRFQPSINIASPELPPLDVADLLGFIAGGTSRVAHILLHKYSQVKEAEERVEAISQELSQMPLARAQHLAALGQAKSGFLLRTAATAGLFALVLVVPVLGVLALALSPQVAESKTALIWSWTAMLIPAWTMTTRWQNPQDEAVTNATASLRSLDQRRSELTQDLAAQQATLEKARSDLGTTSGMFICSLQDLERYNLHPSGAAEWRRQLEHLLGPLPETFWAILRRNSFPSRWRDVLQNPEEYTKWRYSPPDWPPRFIRLRHKECLPFSWDHLREDKKLYHTAEEAGLIPRFVPRETSPEAAPAQ